MQQNNYNIKNKIRYDKTIYYVIRELLNEGQRRAIAKALGDPEQNDDVKLFKFLMENLEKKDSDNESTLDPTALKVLKISAAAHFLCFQMGGTRYANLENPYNKDKNSDKWFFVPASFSHELNIKHKINSQNYGLAMI